MVTSTSTLAAQPETANNFFFVQLSFFHFSRSRQVPGQAKLLSLFSAYECSASLFKLRLGLLERRARVCARVCLCGRVAWHSMWYLLSVASDNLAKLGARCTQQTGLGDGVSLATACD